MKINQPPNSRGLTWSPTFAVRWSAKFTMAQRFVDSEVLRYSDQLTPRQTGYLINSGKTGTVIGSGLVKYTARYAAPQYYNTAESRPYDANRGGRWFERMKTAYKQAILDGVRKFTR